MAENSSALLRESSEVRTIEGSSGTKYELGPTLGKGKFGKVKGAVNLLTGQRVAVKIIKKALVHDGGNGSEVAREVRCLQAINHPNVLTLHDVVDTEKKLYIVLDLAEGGDFFEYILSLYGDGHTFSMEEGRAYFRQLINGVQACHAVGIAHRDLKPENLLLREVQTPGVLPVEGTLLVSDFGLSNWFRSQEGTGQYPALLGTPCGSTKYAAPEIIQGKGMYVPSSIDVWSMGVILYIMFAGQFPFTEAVMRCELFAKYMNGTFEWPSSFPADLVDLLSGMLCVEPTRRWTIPQIKQSAFWMTDLPASPAAADPLDAPFNVEILSSDSDLQVEDAESHILPTAMDLSIVDELPELDSPVFQNFDTDMMQTAEMEYRSTEVLESPPMPPHMMAMNVTVAQMPVLSAAAPAPAAAEAVPQTATSQCPRKQTEQMRVQAISRRSTGCSVDETSARKLEEQMAGVRTKAALNRLASKLPAKQTAASASASASAEDSANGSQYCMSPGLRSIAEFGHTKKKYRLALQADTAAATLAQVESTLAECASDMKAKGIEGYNMAVTRSTREPLKTVRIEITYKGQTTQMAARLEHLAHPVVCFVRKSGCAFDFHNYFTEIKRRLVEKGASEAPPLQQSLSPKASPEKATPMDM